MKNKKLKKSLTEFVDDKLTYPDLFEEIKANANLKSRNKKENYFMKKKLIISFASVLSLFLIVGIVIFALSNPSKPNDKVAANAIVQVDVNPSVEFVIDEDNRVVSVYGKNDDGKMIISGEAFVNKTIDDALELLVKLETETGFLVAGNVTASDNEITITVSAETSETVKNIQTKVESALNEACEKYDINKVIDKAEGYVRSELIQIVKNLDSTYPDEKLEAMTYQQLLMAIELYHLEVADLYSVKLEEMYKRLKEKEIAFSKSEKVMQAIDSLDSAYQSFKDSYQNTYTLLINEKANLQNLYYEKFISEDSEYQKALKELQELKQEIISLEHRLATEELSFIEETELLINLSSLKTNYSVKNSFLSSCESAAELSINASISILEEIISSMLKIEESFPAELKTTITNSIAEIDNNLNALKAEFFNKFETAHRSDIEKIKLEVENRKEALKAAIAE